MMSLLGLHCVPLVAHMWAVVPAKQVRLLLGLARAGTQ